MFYVFLRFFPSGLVRRSASVLPPDSRERQLFLVHSRQPHLEKRLIDGLLTMQPRFQAAKCIIDQPRLQVNIPSINIHNIESIGVMVSF